MERGESDAYWRVGPMGYVNRRTISDDGEGITELVVDALQQPVVDPEGADTVSDDDVLEDSHRILSAMGLEALADAMIDPEER